MVSMDSVGRRTWAIIPSLRRPGTVEIKSSWMDPTEPQGWVVKERLVSLRSPIRWVDVKSVYSPEEYGTAGFRMEKNLHPSTFDSLYTTQSIILPPVEHIPMTVVGAWSSPQFYSTIYILEDSYTGILLHRRTRAD
ncbi:hypothetical protein ABW20_dc0106450 [Dactylellina cionopaga]|nr:hypothetical protein ABW20_dc0106450 [Dactylellina cionopaga]